MKNIYKLCGKISLCFYLLFLYQAWYVCQYGGLRRHLLILLISLSGILLSSVLWMIARKKMQQTSQLENKVLLRIEIFLALLGTIYFGGRIIYSAIPYNGHLSWKLDELWKKREVDFVHDNFFEDGIEGILTDLEEKLEMPENLYVVNGFKMSFNETGKVQTLDTFLYGKNKKGTEKTYLITYDRKKDEKIIVWVNGEANADYNDDMRFEPMLRILEKADSENQVKIWSSILENETYELVYYGRRSFGVMDGLRYLPGDADGDGVDQGSENFTQLFNGGEIVGFEVSLHMPAVKDITPVRYMMEPEYISQEVLDKEQMDEVKDVESWTVDQTDGSMYFFLDDKIGWRLVVADAAAGNRFYQLEKTADGGDTWEMANQNPFGGNLGVTEGLEFFDKNFGFAGLTGASQSYSSLYVTRDGGTTFTELQLPLETVTELPPLAKELNFTIENYKYCEMPKKKEDILTIKLLTGAGEIQGIRFESKDNGETWAYDGISVE